MLNKLVDDIRDSTGSALRLTSLAAAVALCLFVTTAFLCAAAFVFVNQRYGAVQACLAGAGVFFMATALAAICYAVRKRQIKKRPVQAAKSGIQAALSDPMMLAAGMQIIRTVGITRMIPLLAVGGIALGFIASRRDTAESADADTE